jgi:uncharacterized membrane protein YidH (DUF202 family)
MPTSGARIITLTAGDTGIKIVPHMAWLCTSTALVVAMIVMARALHHFSELGSTGPVEAATQAVGVCAILVTALSLAILSVPNG